MTGSSNFTHNSLENYCVEAGIFTRCKQVLEDYNKLFLYYQAQSAPVTFENPSSSIVSSSSMSLKMIDCEGNSKGRETSVSRLQGLRGSQAGVGRCMACRKQYVVEPGFKDGLMMYCLKCRPAATKQFKEQTSSDAGWVECCTCATVFHLSPGEVVVEDMQCPACRPAKASVAPPPGLSNAFSCFPFARDKRQGKGQRSYALPPSSKSASPVTASEPLGLTH